MSDMFVGQKGDTPGSVLAGNGEFCVINVRGAEFVVHAHYVKNLIPHAGYLYDAEPGYVYDVDYFAANAGDEYGWLRARSVTDLGCALHDIWQGLRASEQEFDWPPRGAPSPDPRNVVLTVNGQPVKPFAWQSCDACGQGLIWCYDWNTGERWVCHNPECARYEPEAP